jgi:hypothetical protein
MSQDVVVEINIGLAGVEHDAIAIEYNCPALFHGFGSP